MNFLAILVAALVSLPIGFIWYNPKVFGNAWMKSIGKSREELSDGAPNMILILGLSIIFAFMIALVVTTNVIHQSGLYSLLAEIDGSANGKVEILLNGTSIDYANLHRTFGHGVLHGLILSIFLIMPIIAQSAIYERKGFKYIAINAGYWIVTIALMGGIICMWK